ncbi:hypothetical protein B0H13DRAFT_1882382 [Mycena leptocephala]|nr:hypothetical protein B0H13DRAFT_1882382 [Mycena leptocephala]
MKLFFWNLKVLGDGAKVSFNSLLGSGWYRIYKEQPDVPCAEIVRSALEHTPNLQNLSIVGELPLLDILSAVSSSILISIRIYYYIVQGNELRLGSSWTAVDAALAGIKFCSLKSFHVHASLSLAEGWQNLHLTGTPEVDNEMPLAAARGILYRLPHQQST